jgi:hypothetical protein
MDNILSVAMTRQVDDSEAAVKEILEQLGGKPERGVALFACDISFYEEGTLFEITKALGIPCSGIITGALSLKGKCYSDAFAVIVSRLDESFFDYRFIAGTENARERFKDAVGELTSEKKPALLFYLGAMTEGFRGDAIRAAVDEVCPDIPLFGTCSPGSFANPEETYVYLNGEVYLNNGSFICAMYGDFNLEFIFEPLGYDTELHHKYYVTKSQGPYIYEINNKPVTEVLTSLGFSEDSVLSIAFVLEYPDGSNRVISSYNYKSDSGYLELLAEIPDNVAIKLSSVEYAKVIDSNKHFAHRVLERCNELGNVLGCLIINCVIRTFTCLVNFDDYKAIDNVLGGNVKYLTLGGGGEYCPREGKDGKRHNEYQNIAAVACVFK